MTIRSTHTARKYHRCDAGFTCESSPRGVIKRHERYTRVVYPPWTLVDDDPEYPATKLGEWFTYRYHLSCYYP